MKKKNSLVKLTRENSEYLLQHKIFCFEYSASYMRELFYDFKDFRNNYTVIDTNPRNQGVHLIDEQKISVYGLNYLDIHSLDNIIFLITSDYFYEAYEILSEYLSRREYTEAIYYFSNNETEREMVYRKKYENQPLNDIILFRSGPHQSAYVKGMDYSDNARALFEYMLANDYNEKYELVWMVKNPEDFSKYAKIKNVNFISFDWAMSEEQSEWDEYYRVLCLAKFIFFTDAYGFARNCRADQIRVQLWHGCGFKTRVNFVRCEKRYEYTTVISDLYSKIHQKIYGLREDQMLVTGYAKQDWLFSPIDDFATRLSLPSACKYIFWLPTFRMAKAGLSNLNEYEYGNQTGLPIVDSLEKCEILNELLVEKNTVLILKLHPFQDKSKISNVNYSNIVMLDNDFLFDNDFQINQLLGCSDALISDYSSAAVDYMLLDKPIAFTLDDVDEYSDSRGFVFDNIKEWLPGEELYSFADFCRFIEEVSEGKDNTSKKRRCLLKKMHKYHDNQSCKRIVEVLNI